MLVPGLLFGTAREVQSSVGTVLTRLKRGATLQRICEESDFVDLAEHPESLIFMDRVRSFWRASDVRDFRAATFTYALCFNHRIPFEVSNALREQSVDYLSLSPWGTVVLNSGQARAWQTLAPVPTKPPGLHCNPCRNAEPLGHAQGFGARYCGPVTNRTFPETLPAYGLVLADLGVDPKTSPGRWSDIRQACDNGNLLQRLRTDDAFWEEFVRSAQIRNRAPELLAENVEEIARLCEEGSWRKPHWDFLRAQRGTQAVQEALAKVIARNDVNILLGVYIHVLGDMARAAALYQQHADSDWELKWAADRVASYVAKQDPRAAAAACFVSAEKAVVLPDRQQAIGLMVAALDEAQGTLVDAGLQCEWHQRLDAFSKAHRGSRAIA
jgi:hypothetical protein